MLNQTQPYNWFPLFPMMNLTTDLRDIHQAPNLAHIEIEPQGTIVKIRVDHVLTTTLTPHPFLAHMDVEIYGSLNLTTGDIDYHELFVPTSFFQPLHPLDANPYFYFNLWTSWARMLEVPEALTSEESLETRNYYNPDLIILTETSLSSERANTIISSLGFERFLKVDSMGFWEVYGFYGTCTTSLWNLWQPPYMKCF